MGTDELGRDRLARLAYGAGISLTLAPASAVVACTIALAFGVTAAWFGRWWGRLVLAATHVLLSFPWLVLVLTVRAALPLNLETWQSLGVTFLLQALLGWGISARVLREATLQHLRSGWLTAARARGLPEWRLLAGQILPGLWPELRSQLQLLLPAFLAAEATLGLLGLGVAEPLPSLGGLLADLQEVEAIAENPGMLAAPLLLCTVLLCFHNLTRQERGARNDLA